MTNAVQRTTIIDKSVTHFNCTYIQMYDNNKRMITSFEIHLSFRGVNRRHLCVLWQGQQHFFLWQPQHVVEGGVHVYEDNEEKWEGDLSWSNLMQVTKTFNTNLHVLYIYMYVHLFHKSKGKV